MRKLSNVKTEIATPCGLYCGACIDYVVYRNCHGCRCECGECKALEHRKLCDLYNCCVKQKNLVDCSECGEFPCARLIRFCYNPVWLHHLPVIENLRRRKAIGIENWLKEQKEVWSNQWYLRRWLWFQRECEKRLKQSQEESNTILPEQK